MRYPDADIEVEYLKEKARQKKKRCEDAENAIMGLLGPKLMGATPKVHENSLVSPDAWNNSLQSTASLTFEGV